MIKLNPVRYTLIAHDWDLVCYGVDGYQPVYIHLKDINPIFRRVKNKTYLSVKLGADCVTTFRWKLVKEMWAKFVND